MINHRINALVFNLQDPGLKYICSLSCKVMAFLIIKNIFIFKRILALDIKDWNW